MAIVLGEFARRTEDSSANISGLLSLSPLPRICVRNQISVRLRQRARDASHRASLVSYTCARGHHLVTHVLQLPISFNSSSVGPQQPLCSKPSRFDTSVTRQHWSGRDQVRYDLPMCHHCVRVGELCQWKGRSRSRARHLFLLDLVQLIRWVTTSGRTIMVTHHRTDALMYTQLQQSLKQPDLGHLEQEIL